MLFSKAQQAAMNLVADLMSEVKTTQEKYKAQGLGEVCGYEEKEVIYVLNDVAMKVKVSTSIVRE